MVKLNCSPGYLQSLFIFKVKPNLDLSETIFVFHLGHTLCSEKSVDNETIEKLFTTLQAFLGVSNLAGGACAAVDVAGLINLYSRDEDANLDPSLLRRKIELEKKIKLVYGSFHKQFSPLIGDIDVIIDDINVSGKRIYLLYTYTYLMECTLSQNKRAPFPMIYNLLGELRPAPNIIGGCTTSNNSYSAKVCSF